MLSLRRLGLCSKSSRVRLKANENDMEHFVNNEFVKIERVAGKSSILAQHI